MTYERDPHLAAYIDQQLRARPNEAKLVKKLWKALKAAGVPIISFYDGEETGDIGSKQELLDIVFNLDEVWLHTEGGAIYLVFGNDLDELFSDYNVSLESIIEPLQKWAEKRIGR